MIGTLIAVLLVLGAILFWIFRPRRLARKLGYPSDARLLIIHADDFGVCPQANAATIRALETGVVTSTSLMAPCPAFDEAAAYCRDNPNVDAGVHLTFTNEYEKYHWGPVSPAAEVPGLVNTEGHFYRTTAEVWQHASAEEIEKEMRAQVEKVLEAGVRPTHVDSHMGVMFGPKFLRVYLRVASEYRLPAMLPRQYIHSEQSHGLKSPYRFLQWLLSLWFDAMGQPMIDRLYVGGLDEVTVPQDEYYPWVIQDLTPGVNEVLVHPVLDGEDVGFLGERAERRVEDFRIMTDPATRRLIESNGVVLVGYKPIVELVRK